MKTMKRSSTSHKARLPKFCYSLDGDIKSAVKPSRDVGPREVVSAQRDMAKERGFTTKYILLSYDLLSTSPSFHGDLTTKL